MSNERDIYVVRGPNGALLPADHESEALIEALPIGSGIRMAIVQEISPARIVRHRRFFKMIGVGFDAWEPPEIEYGGLPAVKNAERFRYDVTTAAGFYDIVVGLDGKPKLEAHSIAFVNMSDERFELVYSGVKSVLLSKVLPASYTDPELERVVDELLRF